MNVREMIEILHDFHGDDVVKLIDRSSGESVDIIQLVEFDEGDDTLAFEIDTYNKEYLMCYPEKVLEHFITACGFDWTVDEILNVQYPNYNNEVYVSHTAKLCCQFYENCIVHK